MADLIPWSNLLPQYQSPQQMQQSGANTAQTNAQTGLLQAQTNLIGEQAQGADIQNQGALTQFNLIQRALSGGVPDASAVPVPGAQGTQFWQPGKPAPIPTGAPAPGGGITPGSSGLPQGAAPGPGGTQTPGGNNNGTNPPGSGHPSDWTPLDNVAALAQQKYGPVPVQFSPDEQRWIQQMRSTGNPLLAAQADAFQNGRIQATQQENSKRQYAATSAYQNAVTVASAADSGASSFAVLSRLHPEIASVIAQQHPDDFTTDSAGNVTAKPSGEADTAAFAKSVAATVYPHTGRESTMQNGVLIDTKSVKPVPGVDQVLTGLTGEQKQKAWDAALAPTTVKNSDGTESQVPAYKASGMLGGPVFNTPWDFVAAADRAARAPTNAPAIPGTPSAAGPAASASTPSSVIPRMIGPGGPPQSQSLTTGAAQGNSATAQQAASPPINPVLKQALSDPDYKIKAPPVVAGRTPTPAELDQQKATVQARTDLLKDSQDATSAAAQSLQYLQAAKSIMDSKGATVGAYGGLVNQASKWLPFTGNVDATNYAEVAKYLGNAALANAKGTYGAKMTQSEVGLQLNELSPSVKMPDQAISNLLDSNIKSAQYTIDSARRTRPYLASGGDPQSYADWNQKYFPREKAINGASPALPTRPGQNTSGPAVAAPAVGTVRGGYKYAGGDPSNKASWVKQ